MRPRLEGELEEEIEQAVDEHHYDTPTEFVRDAVRRRLEELGQVEKVRGRF